MLIYKYRIKYGDNMKEKKVGTILKNETKVIAYVVICLVIIVLGVSYALFFEVKGNEKNQIVKAGTLEFTYVNGSQLTSKDNADCFIPMTLEQAKNRSECEYKVGIHNSGTLPGNYNLKLVAGSTNNVDLSKLKVILKKDGVIEKDYPKPATTSILVENAKIGADKDINYTVQVYVDDALIEDTDDGKNIELIIDGDAVVNDEELNPAVPE